MKKNPSKSAKSKLKSKYPVPQWMDDDLKPTAEKLDILQRHELANKLERQAEQLREMKQPRIKLIENIEFSVRPNMKAAILVFANYHGDKSNDEKTKLNHGTRWILEAALSEIKLISDIINRMVHYRDAEGFEDSVYTEKLIGDALEKWQTEIAKSEDDDSEE